MDANVCFLFLRIYPLWTSFLGRSRPHPTSTLFHMPTLWTVTVKSTIAKKKECVSNWTHHHRLDIRRLEDIWPWQYNTLYNQLPAIKETSERWPVLGHTFTYTFFISFYCAVGTYCNTLELSLLMNYLHAPRGDTGKIIQGVCAVVLFILLLGVMEVMRRERKYRSWSVCYVCWRVENNWYLFVPIFGIQALIILFLKWND